MATKLKFPPEHNERRAHRLLFEGVLNSLASTGDLTEEVLGDPEAMESLVLDTLDKLHIGFDYRRDLLTEGARHWAAGKHELAYVFYATFFEHSINFIIVNHIAKRLLPASRIELVRTLPLPAKFGWLLELAGLPKFNPTHRLRILQVAERRNAFIHYKFPTEPISAKESKPSPSERNAEFEQILSAVKYIKAYSTKLITKGMSGKVSKAVARSKKGA